MQPRTNASHYDLIGGESALQKLVDRFYDLMYKKEIRHWMSLNHFSRWLII
jgi:truncated hemoglobin YjbI